MSYDLEEYWEERANSHADPPDCALCGEPFMNHSSTGQCLVEVTGLRSPHYEPIEASDIIAEENPENV